MTTSIQDKPRPPWRNTFAADWVRDAQRGVAARRHVRAHNRSLPAAAPVLNFYPMLPTRRMHIAWILEHMGLRIGTSPRANGPVIAWETGTLFPDAVAAQLPTRAINARCLDISKGCVDRTWAAASGYSIQVDPLTTNGPVVVKSERNGRHDGRIVDGPLREVRPGNVYQRYVDASDERGTLELRTAIVGDRVPTVREQWRPPGNWGARSTQSAVRVASEVYSATEIGQLLVFAGLIGLDYGELDVLRDRDSGLIYVVDANRTPYGPPRMLAPSEVARAVALMSDAFSRLLIGRS